MRQWKILQIKKKLNEFTPMYFLPMTSLTTYSTISMRVMTISCNGDVLPMTTPNEIRTAAAAKSLTSILQSLMIQISSFIVQAIKSSGFELGTKILLEFKESEMKLEHKDFLTFQKRIWKQFSAGFRTFIKSIIINLLGFYILFTWLINIFDTFPFLW